jgi:hypothetical protein
MTGSGLPSRHRFDAGTHPSSWRGFSFGLDFLQHLLKCLYLVPRFFVFRLLF